jgi:hypothetical protein
VRVQLAAATLAALVATTAGVGLAGASSQAPGTASAPPGAEPIPCNPQSAPVKMTVPPIGPDPVCGSRYDDELRAKHGGSINSFPGNDKVWAKNGKANEVWGGPGRNDVAYVDAKDTVHDIEKCPNRPRGRCPKAAASFKSVAAGQVEFPASEPVVVCDHRPGTTERRVWLAAEPMIRAADTTPRVDWQTVAYTPVLTKWDGVKWVVNQEKVWLFDRTFDPSERATPFIGNYWRDFKNKQRGFFVFNIVEPGTYRVWVKYYWYKTPHVAAHEIGDYVNAHYGEFETDNKHETCTFP